MKFIMLLTLLMTSQAFAQSISQATTDTTAFVTFSPLITTFANVNICKEDVEQVRNDAYDYLAGEPMTIALEEQILRARESEPKLSEASDQEIVKVFIEITN